MDGIDGLDNEWVFWVFHLPAFGICCLRVKATDKIQLGSLLKSFVFPNFWIRLSSVMSFHFIYLLDLNLFLVFIRSCFLQVKLSHSSGSECGLHAVCVYVCVWVSMRVCVLYLLTPEQLCELALEKVNNSGSWAQSWLSCCCRLTLLLFLLLSPLMKFKHV